MAGPCCVTRTEQRGIGDQAQAQFLRAEDSLGLGLVGAHQCASDSAGRHILRWSLHLDVYMQVYIRTQVCTCYVYVCAYVYAYVCV